MVEKIPHLASLGNVVPDGYTYYQKLVTSADDLSLLHAYLKWYNIRRPDVEITPDQLSKSRAFLAAEVEAGRLKIEGELGFVLLHHVGSALLLLQTWRCFTCAGQINSLRGAFTTGVSGNKNNDLPLLNDHRKK
jgi:DNA-directed RNA polymerase subunit N (RpoN/RPB10)